MCQRFDRTRELAHLCNRRARRTVRYARFVVAVRSRSPQRPNAQSVKACVSRSRAFGCDARVHAHTLRSRAFVLQWPCAKQILSACKQRLRRLTHSRDWLVGRGIWKEEFYAACGVSTHTRTHLSSLQCMRLHGLVGVQKPTTTTLNGIPTKKNREITFSPHDVIY